MNNFDEVCSLIAKSLNHENPSHFIHRSSKKMQANFAGYHANFSEIFANKIPNTRYSSPIIFQNIHFLTYCKHHFAPIIGDVTVSYAPNSWIVGFSKIIECINAITKRLQLQEDMTVQIAEKIHEHLNPKSVSVKIEARHYCMQQYSSEKPPLITTFHEIL